ncbi:MAG: shikimate kinase [Bacteroidia bacterium]
MKIFLVGFMGSGKSSVARVLAQKLNLSFFDTDHEIVASTGKSINEIFEKDGESHFRELEKLTIQNLQNKDNCVIACGGGLPCHNNLMRELNNQGITVYLKLSSERLFDRLQKDSNKRPLLLGKNESEMKKYISHLLDEREFYYSQSQFKISIKDHNAEEVADAIVKYIK